MCLVMPFAEMRKTGGGAGLERGNRNQKFCFYFVKSEVSFRYPKWRCQIGRYALDRGAQGSDLGWRYQFGCYRHIDGNLSQGLDGRN